MEQNGTALGGWERRTSARAQNQRQTEKFPKSLQNLLCTPKSAPEDLQSSANHRV